MTTYVCRGCGVGLDDAQSATLWMNTEYGLSTLRCCPTQQCAKDAVERAPAGWTLRRGNLPPFRDADERDAFLRARAERRGLAIGV